MNSVLIKWLISIFETVYRFIKNSVTGKTFNNFDKRIRENAKNSIILNWIINPSKLDWLYKTGLIARVTRLGAKFLNLISFLKKGAEQSYIIKSSKNFAENLIYYSIRLYGIGIITFSSLYLAYCIFIGKENKILLFSLIFLCIFGAILILINKNLKNLCYGSAIAKISTLFITGKKLENSEDKKVNEPYISFVVLGFLTAVSAILFGTLPTVLTLVAVFSFIIILKMPTCGIIITIGILPFMPTMAMVAATVGMAVIAIVLYIFTNDIESSYRIVNLLVIMMAGMVVYGAISSFAVFNSITVAMVYLAFISFYFTTIKIIKTKKTLFSTLSILTLASFPVAVYGIYQKFFGGDQLAVWIDQDMFSNITGRVISFFGNPNVLGEYLIILIILCVIRLLLSKTKVEKFVFSIILVSLSLCMVYTYSRGCWVGIIIAAAIFFIMYSRKIFGFLTLAGISSIFFLPNTIINRFTSIGNVADTSTSYRVSIWEGTIKMLKDFWPTGIGLGTKAFNMTYPLYSHSAINAPHSHNLYLQITTELGIVGLIIFILLIVMCYKNMFEVFARTNDKLLKLMSTAWISAMTGFLVQGLFDNTWYNYRIYLLFWILVALGTVTFNLHRKEVPSC